MKIENSANSSLKKYLSGILGIFFVYFIFVILLHKLTFWLPPVFLNLLKNIEMAYFLSNLVVDPIIWGSIIIVLTLIGLRLCKLSVVEIGFNKETRLGKNIVGFVVGCGACFLLTMLFFQVQCKCLPSCSVSLNQIDFSSLRFVHMLIASMLIGPILEEIFYRGFIQTALEKRFNFEYALLIPAVLFTISHAYKITQWHNMLTYLIIGIIYGLLRRWDKSLFPAIIAHICFNTISLIFTIACK